MACLSSCFVPRGLCGIRPPPLNSGIRLFLSAPSIVMISKEAIKSEIEKVPSERLEELYRVVKTFTESQPSERKKTFMTRWREIKIDGPEDFAIRSTKQPRQDWESAFRALAKRGDDGLLDNNSRTQTQWDEWQ